MKNVKILLTIFLVIFNFSLMAQNFTDIFDSQIKYIYRDFPKIEYQIINSKILESEIEDLKITLNEPVISFIVNVPIHIKYKNQSKYKSDVISLRMQIYDNVVICNKQIDIGDKLSEINLRIEQTNIISIKKNYFKNMNEVVGKIAKVKIYKDQIITKNMVKDEPLIRYQDKITAILKIGNVEISFDAIAKNEGQVGETINIQDKRGQIFKAKILDVKTVVIEK